MLISSVRFLLLKPAPRSAPGLPPTTFAADISHAASPAPCGGRATLPERLRKTATGTSGQAPATALRAPGGARTRRTCPLAPAHLSPPGSAEVPAREHTCARRRAQDSPLGGTGLLPGGQRCARSEGVGAVRAFRPRPIANAFLLPFFVHPFYRPGLTYLLPFRLVTILLFRYCDTFLRPIPLRRLNKMKRR